MKNNKIMILQYGCLSNQVISKRVELYLIENKYKLTKILEESDVLIISACVVKKESEEKLIKTIEHNVRKKIIVIGCISPDIKSQYENISFLEEMSNIELLFPPDIVEYNLIKLDGEPNYYAYIPDYIDNKLVDYIKFEKILSRINEELAESFKNSVVGFEFVSESKPYYRVVVSTGCNFKCSYCLIWKIKGKYKSRTISDVLSDIEQGYTLGYKKFILIGDELSSYGIDIYKKYVLGELLCRINSRFKDIKIAIRYLEPMVLPKIWESIKKYINNDFISYINIPIQSGSVTILKNTNRHIEILKLADIIKDIRQNYNGPLLTHIMVGFDFEDINDINKTALFLEKFFDNTSIHRFSPRPNTAFATLKTHACVIEHEKIIEDIRYTIRTKYLKRILRNIATVKEKAHIQKEKEYRFSTQKLSKETLSSINKFNWSEEETQTDIVFMNKNVDGFVARIRSVNSLLYLQFKMKNELHDWSEISIGIEKEELKSILMVLNDYFQPRNIITRKRKFFTLRNNVSIYFDSLKHIGEYIEIEGVDENVDDTLFNLFKLTLLDVEEPYGKILENLNIDTTSEIESFLQMMNN